MESGSESCSHSSFLYLKSAFLAMEPVHCLVSLARQAGGGIITERVQNFILEDCINNVATKGTELNHKYIKNTIQKLISAVEETSEIVVEGLYEKFAYYLTIHLDQWLKESNRIYKQVTFLLSLGKQCSSEMDLVVSLHCSRNMLEGDTGSFFQIVQLFGFGRQTLFNEVIKSVTKRIPIDDTMLRCALWPSSLFLSEFILSFKKIFSNRFCFEIGSGVGLVGITLLHVGASKVILTDGDMSTLANMKSNLELNQLDSENKTTSSECLSVEPLVECRYLPWESASRSELQDYQPDIVLGADIIYDPLCIPHLVGVLSTLLNSIASKPGGNEVDCSGYSGEPEDVGSRVFQSRAKEGPIAYIATVIRNRETFDYFLRLAAESDLCVLDITEMMKPLDLLPYMISYDRSSVHLLKVSFLYKCDVMTLI